MSALLVREFTVMPAPPGARTWVLRFNERPWTTNTERNWHHHERGGLEDVGGCLPAAKAAIDGLVDARVLADDTPDHVVSLTFKTPIIGKGDALELVITDARPAQ